MAIKGFKLTFHDGTVFRCSEQVDVRHEGESIFPIDGLSNIVAVFNQWFDDEGGQQNASDSNLSSVFAGFGAGVHTIVVSFEQIANTSDSWGNATGGSNTAIELRDRLVRSLTTIQMDSNNVGQLEVGEFSSSGIYNYIPVSALNWNIRVAVMDGEPSLAVGEMTFADTVALGEAIDAATRRS